jgi:hypothetical protein
MKILCGFICAAFCLLLSVPASATSLCNSISGNLVADCGFETGSFTGWTLSGNDTPFELGNLYGVEGVDPFDGISPNSGSDQAYFGDLVANSTTLSQTIGTTAAATYMVSFFLAQDTAVGTQPTESNAFSASFGGVVLDNLTGVPVEGYTEFSFLTTATSSSSVLSLTVGDDLGEFLLDDVSVVKEASGTTTTPEPAAWMLMLTGMIGIGLLYKRHVVTAR